VNTAEFSELSCPITTRDPCRSGTHSDGRGGAVVCGEAVSRVARTASAPSP
jgi:hypothetical protein